MKDGTNSQKSWREGLQAACERLVHPEVAGEDRARQTRMIGVLLLAPLLAGPLVAQILSGTALQHYMLAALCMVIAMSWTGAVVIAQTGRMRVTGRAASAGLCLLLAAVLAAGGLLQSPLLLLLAAPPFELWFIHRRREDVAFGWLLSAAALALAGLITLVPTGSSMEFAGHLWVTPIAYAASVWLRLPGWQLRADQPKRLSAAELSRITGSLVAEVTPQGAVEIVSGDAMRLLGVPPEMLLGAGLFDRMRVTDRVSWLTGIDRCRQEGRGEVLEALLRMAGSSEYRRCRLSLAPATPETVFVLVSHMDSGENQIGGKGEAVVPLGRRIAAEVEQDLGLTNEGQEETRRFA